MQRCATLLVTTLALLATGACGTDEPTANATDHAFAEQMIAHHEQALEMSDLIEGSDASDEVARLAEQIAEAQGPEITQMQQWLDDWESDDTHADHGTDPTTGHDGHGMMTADQMAELEAATGEDFDRLWLTFMIEHHEGAIAMAATVLADGEHPDVRHLAEHIITDQQAEIDHMRGLLDE